MFIRMQRFKGSERRLFVRKVTVSIKTSLCSQKLRLLLNSTRWMSSWRFRFWITVACSAACRSAFVFRCGMDSDERVLVSSIGSQVEWLDWNTVQFSLGSTFFFISLGRVTQSSGDLGLMLQFFRFRFECRNRGKFLSCVFSRLFSLVCSRGGAGRGNRVVRFIIIRDYEFQVWIRNSNGNNVC